MQRTIIIFPLIIISEFFQSSPAIYTHKKLTQSYVRLFIYKVTILIIITKKYQQKLMHNTTLQPTDNKSQIINRYQNYCETQIHTQVYQNDCDRFSRLIQLIQKQQKDVAHIQNRKHNVIMQNLKKNKLFSEISCSDQQYEQISKQTELMYVKDSIKLDYSQNEVILILKGSAFEYLQSFYEGIIKHKIKKIHEQINPEYILICKLISDQYFSCYIPNQKYTRINQKRIQIIIEKDSIIAKIRQDTFTKYIQKKIDEHMFRNYNFLKNFEMIESLNKTLIYELSKYIEVCKYRNAVTIYKKGDVSDYYYFIKKGFVALKEEQTKDKIIKKAFEKNHLQSKFMIQQNNRHSIANPKTLILGANKIFGVDGIILNASSQFRECTAETLSDVQLYRINKRCLIALIASHKQISNQYNEINLTIEKTEKQQNIIQKRIQIESARRIKTSETRTKNLKLIKNKSSKLRKMTELIINNCTQENEDQIKDPFMIFNKKLSTHRTSNLLNQDKNDQLQKHQKQLFNLKTQLNQQQLLDIKINQFSKNDSKLMSLQSKQATLHAIIMQPMETQKELQIFKSTILQRNLKEKDKIHKKSQSERSNSARHVYKNFHDGKLNKQTSNQLINFLEKRRNQQLQNKLKTVFHNRVKQKNSQTIKIKRIFKKCHQQIIQKKYQCDQQIIYKQMQNLCQNPLLSQIQSKRKRLLQNQNTNNSAFKKVPLQKIKIEKIITKESNHNMILIQD